jgi:hypothetical protein
MSCGATKASIVCRNWLFFTEKDLTVPASLQEPSAPHPVEIAELGVPTFFVSSFNLSAPSNEVVLVGNELFPTWSGEGAAQPPVLRPRLVIRLSPQSAKDLGDVLQNFVANFERAYGELRTDYLLRKQAGAG